MPQVPSSLPEESVSAIIERQFRAGLWINHGCPFHALYSDDGEMQCNALECRLDFKRMPLAELCVLLTARGRLHAGMAPRWEPIEAADVDTEYLLFSPARRLSDHPDQKDDFRVMSPRNWTWATHFMPLPKGPTT